MKPISSDLAAHLAGEVTTLATCWKVTRRDAAVLGFTDHDQDLVVDSVTYAAQTGFSPSAVASRADFSPDNLEAAGMLAAESLTEADILAGLYDYAEIEIFQVNYADLTQGTMVLRRGWIGEVSLKAGQFVAELRGLSQALSQNIGELYSPSCRASLGDGRCKVDLTPFTVMGTITAALVGARQAFTDSARTEATGLFSGGKITFSSGANSGLSMEVKAYSLLPASAGGAVTLALPMPYGFSVGDAYTMVAGCDKTLGTCLATFNNVLNFRGEPHVPGLDSMMTTAGTRG